MSLQTEIEAITGSISDITAEAVLYANEGNKFVQRVISKNSALAERLTFESELTDDTGLPLDDVINLVSVTRLDSDGGRYRSCNRISYEASNDALDSNSIYFATVTDPKYYLEENRLKIVPTGLSATIKGVVKHITPVDIAALNIASISRLPQEYFRGVVLYAALQVLHKRMNEIDKPTGSTSNLTTLTAGLVSAPADRIDQNKWFDIVGDYIENEDVELASAYLSKINTYLSNYQTELQADIGQYQWYESQYFKVSRQFVEFLNMFSSVSMQPTGAPNEATGND